MCQDFNLSKFLPYRLAVISERVSRRLTVDYERSQGINVAERRVLVHLQWQETVSVREIRTLRSWESRESVAPCKDLQSQGLYRKKPAKLMRALLKLL